MKKRRWCLVAIFVLWLVTDALADMPHNDTVTRLSQIPGTRDKTFVFFFSTGRCGTNYLSKTLRQRREAPAAIKFEYEHGNKASVMKKILHPAMLINDTHAVKNYVVTKKIPAMVMEMDHSGKRIWADTGHQITLGMMEHLIDALGSQIRVVRLRRHRLDTAASFSGDANKKDPCKYAPNENHMHYCPFNKVARIQLPRAAMWDSLNLFQKYLWWVDEVEARWQWILRTRPPFPYIEIDYSTRMGVKELQRISDFTGLGFERAMLKKKHINSHNKRGYPRIWRLVKDEAYRKAMPAGTHFSF